MKTKNILLGLAACLFLLPAMAQQQETTTKKKIHLQLVTEENGKTKIIDQVFDSEEELQEFIKANKEDFPEVPPVPPLPPLPPLKPTGCKPVDSLHCKRVILIDKEIGDKDEANEEVIIRNLGKDDEVITEEIKGKLKGEGDKEEKIIIIRRKGDGEESKKDVQPQVIEIKGDENASRISELSFYPNPNNGNFNVSFKVNEPADALLQITDLNGKVVYTDEVKALKGWYEKNIYRGDLSNGTYIMQVSSGNEKKALKISVQK